MNSKASVFDRTTIFHFTYLPATVRLFYSGALVILGLGYAFAMLQIQASHAGLDGKKGLVTIDDLIIAYSGSKDDTKLESKLKGSMAVMLPDSERAEIFRWIRSGADQSEYDKTIAAIIDQRCASCHNGSNPHLPNLVGFDNIAKVINIDTGMSISTLVRVSHIHMFGILFIFFVIGIIFFHAYVRPTWLKGALLLTPFISVIFDIFSWYLTKVNTAFAWVIVASGIVMGICFAAQWLISFYQMWFYKPPKELVDNQGAVF